MIVVAPGAFAFTTPSRRCRRRRRRRRRSRPPPAFSSLSVFLCPLLVLRSLLISSLVRSCVYVHRSVVGTESVTDKLFLPFVVNAPVKNHG